MKNPRPDCEHCKGTGSVRVGGCTCGGHDIGVGVMHEPGCGDEQCECTMGPPADEDERQWCFVVARADAAYPQEQRPFGPYETREQALTEGRAELAGERSLQPQSQWVLYIGRVNWPSASAYADADGLAERLEEAAYEEFGYDDQVFEVADRPAFQAALDALVDEHMAATVWFSADLERVDAPSI